jgi:hypothetical protein
MCLFRTFDTYVVKVLRGHPKDGRRKLKHHTIFCVQQQPPGNIYGFYVCINIVIFEVQPNYSVCIYFTLLSIFIIKYAYSFLIIHTSHFIVTGP